jgi:hypothetical protein
VSDTIVELFVSCGGWKLTVDSLSALAVHVDAPHTWTLPGPLGAVEVTLRATAVAVAGTFVGTAKVFSNVDTGIE